MRGQFAMTEAVFFHRASGAAIFADLIQASPAIGSRAGARPSLASAGSSRPIPARRAIGVRASLIDAQRGRR